MTALDAPRAVSSGAPRRKTALLSRAVSSGHKTALTCGNTDTRRCLIETHTRQPNFRQNRRSDAVSRPTPYGRGGSSGHPPPHPLRERRRQTTTGGHR